VNTYTMHQAPEQQTTADDSKQIAPTIIYLPGVSKNAPWTLRWSDRGIKNNSAFLGLVFGIGLAIACNKVLAPSTLAGRMFRFDSMEGSLPVIMLVMFCIGVTLLLLRWLRLLRVEHLCTVQIVSGLQNAIHSTPLAHLVGALDSVMVTPFSPLLRRTRSVFNQWINRPSLQDATALLELQTFFDDEGVRHGYSTVQTFIWSLPVLGLIGTVIGIATAVGDFGGFIASDIDDIEAIKVSLVHVTGGLSYAFSTTFLGMLGAILLVLPSSALRTREEKLSADVHKMIASTIIPILQNIMPEATTQTAEKMQNIIQQSIEISMEKQLVRVNHNLHDSANELRTSLVQQGAVIQESAEGLAQCAHSISKSMSTAIDSQHQLYREITHRLEHLATLTAAVMNGSQSTLETLSKIDQRNIEATMAKMLAAIERLSQPTQDAVHAVRALSESTDNTLVSQQLLQQAMSQIHELGLTKTMSLLTQSLQQVVQALRHLREPLVFQAVTASSLAGANAQSQEGHR